MANAPRVDLQLVGKAGDQRRKGLKIADDALEAIVTEVMRVQGEGGKVNVSAVCRIAQVDRSWVYDRIKARRKEGQQ